MTRLGLVALALTTWICGTALAQTPPAAPPPAGTVPAAKPPPTPAACPGNPDALGVARTVEIDTTGGPGFGFEHYKQHDFLQQKEVVLTFDDGPWPATTRAVLDALAAHCTKATFFPIGKHALWHPDIIKDVLAQGHTVGSHTWSHANLAKASPEKMKEEIEKGFSAVKIALGSPPSAFFRFPFLQGPPAALDYLGSRNVSMFSTDVDSFDFKFRKPDQVIKSVMDRLEKKGKGIVLMHDFQQSTSKGIAELLQQLKVKGYKVVHMKAKDTAKTLPEFDELASKEVAGAGTGTGRPTSSVVRTVP